MNDTKKTKKKTRLYFSSARECNNVVHTLIRMTLFSIKSSSLIN